jgi:hypothetical protein
MKMKFMMWWPCLAALSVATAACSPATLEPNWNAGPPPQHSTTAAADAIAVQAAQKLVVANESYQSAVLLMETAVDAGLVNKPRAIVLKELSDTAAAALARAGETTIAVSDKLYWIEKASDAADAIKRLLGGR